MIQEVQGDILLTNAAAIAHGVAPGDHFDSGLALQLRGEWPALARDFRHHCHTTHPGPGDLWTWSAATGLRIFNLLTQEPPPGEHGHGKPGRARLEHVNHALRALRKALDAEPVASLALPRIATGVGGLAWAEVRPLIVQHLGDLPFPVQVYVEYKKGVRVPVS